MRGIHPSYSREMRARAKKSGVGLITISWNNETGCTSTLQCQAGPKLLALVKRAYQRALDEDN